jgi:hypothetical protein
LKELSRAKRLKKGIPVEPGWAGKRHSTPAMLPSASSLMLTCLLAVPLLWGGCRKGSLFPTTQGSVAQPDELPPITTTGEGTFACKINGVNWQRCGGGFLQSSILGNWSPNYKILSMFGERECEEFDDYIRIVAYVDSIGKYDLHYAMYGNHNLDCQESTEPSHLLEGADNWVEILNLDTEEFIVSGTSQCTLVDDNCNDTIYITDGRFDYDWTN